MKILKIGNHSLYMTPSVQIKLPYELNHLLNQAANGPTIFDDIHDWNPKGILD